MGGSAHAQRRGASSFYGSLAGFDLTRATSQEADLRVFRQGGEVRGGLVVLADDSIDPAWLPYVGVEDLEETLGRAVALGAKPIAWSSGAAIVLDPQGAAFGLAELEGASR